MAPTLLDRLREPRVPIAGRQVAVFDLGGTIAVGFYIANRTRTNALAVLVALFAAGFVAHRALGVKTQILS